MRQENHTIKTKLNKSPRCLQHKKSFHRYLSNDLTFIARKATFRTQNRFHNKQYTPKSKDQPHGSDRTHFDVRLDNSNVAMHRPTIIFLLSHKSTTVQQKTKTKSHKTITTNNHDKQSIQSFNQKHAQNKHDIQSTAIYNHIYLSQNESGNKITTNNHSTKHYQKQQSFQSAAKTTTTINPRIRQTKTPSKQTQ